MEESLPVFLLHQLFNGTQSCYTLFLLVLCWNYFSLWKTLSLPFSLFLSLLFSLSLFLFLSFFLSLYPSLIFFSLFLSLSVCLSVCLSVSLFLCISLSLIPSLFTTYNNQKTSKSKKKEPLLWPIHHLRSTESSSSRGSHLPKAPNIHLSAPWHKNTPFSTRARCNIFEHPRIHPSLR